tara:strand:+ start:27 stop:671 length:645 start_codon:yes stop_codon:yes gene_type:complete
MTSRFGIIPASIFDADLTPQDIALLALLSTYADKSGYSWPSYETIAAKLNRSKGWVSSRITRLESEGYLRISKRKGQKYGFTIIYDHVQPAEHTVQPSEQSVQPAEPNSTSNNTNNKIYRSKKASVIPEDFKPTEDMLEYIKSNRPDLDPKVFTKKFITSCKAKGYLYKRWDMAWQNWVDGEASPNAKQQKPNLENIHDGFKAAVDLANRNDLN